MLNLRLAIAMAGHQPIVTLLLGGPRSAAVAVVRRGARRDPPPLERALFAAIAIRSAGHRGRPTRPPRRAVPGQGRRRGGRRVASMSEAAPSSALSFERFPVVATRGHRRQP